MRSNGETVIVTIVMLIFVATGLYLTGITAYANGKHDGYKDGYATGAADTENKFWFSCHLQDYSCPEALEKER